MGLLSTVGKGLKALFADDPNQYVEDADEANLTTVAAVAIKNGSISKEDAAKLIQSQRDSVKRAEESNAKVEAEIQILPSDKSDFRNDATMEQAQSTKVNVRPASELENHERKSGGKERDVLQK